MKRHAWIIAFISIAIAVSGCTSKPMYGYKIDYNHIPCNIFEYENQNYEAWAYDVSGKFIATADNLEVKWSSNRYTTGDCVIMASFSKIPLGKGPYKIEYLVNGIKVDEYEFESADEY